MPLPTCSGDETNRRTNHVDDCVKRAYLVEVNFLNRFIVNTRFGLG